MQMDLPTLVLLHGSHNFTLDHIRLEAAPVLHFAGWLARRPFPVNISLISAEVSHQIKDLSLNWFSMVYVKCLSGALFSVV
jgi:hypothetical protein